MTRPAEPRAGFPHRAPGSVRRVAHLDYSWIDAVDVVVHGAARDEVALADGTVHVDDATTLRTATEHGLVSRFTVEPARLDAARFVGSPLRQGFRAVAREVFPPDGSTVGLLLDDISGAMVAAGYVLALEDRLDQQPARATEVPTGATTAARMAQADLCSGWRAEGTMMSMVGAGERMRFEPLPTVPVLPAGADGWPADPIPCPGLRRHRRIDVVAEGAVWRVDAWFRDTYCSPDGTLGSLHEYTVDAVVDASDHTLLEVRAVPHVLPWLECPAAADAVGKVVGLAVGDLRATVQRTLRGIESCTHLTNELRELADLPAMVARSRN